MIKKFYLFENTLYSFLKNTNDEDKLKELIGFDTKNYELTVINNNEFELSFKEDFLTNFLDLEDGMFRLFLSITSNYSDYELYIDDSEIDFISRDLTEENLDKLKLLYNFLDVEEDDNEKLYYICKILGDDLIDIRDIIYEVSAAREEAVVHDANEVLKKLPFRISSAYTGGWDIDILFNIEDIGEYIEKNNLKDINTISDFLENVDFSDFSYDIENYYESSYDIDYGDMNKEFGKQMDSLLTEIGIDPTAKPKDNKDDKQLNLFDDDEYSKMISKNYKFNRFFSKLKFTRIYEIKSLGGRILAWFKSYEFQKNYMRSAELKNYEKLKEYGIMHPDIEDEYGYLVAANTYNL
jgi:hypothetical protein